MIHELEDGRFVISSRQVWMPGSYASRRAANLAFRLPDETLARLQVEAGVGGSITYEAVLAAYREHIRRGSDEPKRG